jgi:hypothetical protein
MPVTDYTHNHDKPCSMGINYLYVIPLIPQHSGTVFSIFSSGGQDATDIYIPVPATLGFIGQERAKNNIF